MLKWERSEELLIKTQRTLFILLTGDKNATRKRKKMRKRRRRKLALHERMKYVEEIRRR